MKITDFSHDELKSAYKVLDALQNEITHNKTLPLNDLIMRFDIISEMKNKIDVRTVQEKISTEQILLNSQSEESTASKNRSQKQNNLFALLGQYEQLPIKAVSK